MFRPNISTCLLLCGGLLAGAFCWAPQARGANPRGTVNVDSLPVHSEPSQSSPVVVSLKRGEVVTIELVMTAGGGRWCSIRGGGEKSLSGFVACQSLTEEPVAEPVRTASPKGPVERLDADAAINEILRLSGVQSQINQLADPGILGAFLGKLPVQGREAAEINRILKQSFRPEAFSGPIRAALKANESPEVFASLLEWLRSPLMRKMTTLELRAGSFERAQEFLAYAARLPNSPPAQERLRRVQDLDRAAHISEFQMEMPIEVFRAMGASLNPVLPPEKRLSDAQFTKIAGQMKADLQTRTQNLVLARLLYTYQSASDSELEDYAKFWESPLGSWFRTIVNQSEVQAIRQVVAHATALLIDSAAARKGGAAPHK